MKILTQNIKLFQPNKHIHYCTVPKYIYPSEKDEYTEKAEYPPVPQIKSDSPQGKEKKWSNFIKRQSTVEEKLFAVNVERRWGWKCFMIHEGVIPLNNLDFAKHITKTHVIQNENLPTKNLYKQCQELSRSIKSDVIDAIEYQMDVVRPDISVLPEFDQEHEMTRIIITEINRIIMNSLWDKESHLKDIQIDYTPRIEASWKVGSLVETFQKKREKHQIPEKEIPEEFLERPSDKFIQYKGKPILQMRASHPLPPLMDWSDACILQYSVPTYNYDPHIVLGYEMNRRYLTNIPGFWPGDEREFSFLSYHNSNHLKQRPPSYGPEDEREALISQAIFASFGWLMPVACYLGFSSFYDVTYPIVTQTVLTDGKQFTFAAYQLNTTELSLTNHLENLRSNICWVTPTKSLYEAIEDGKLKGFDEEVLENLVLLYLNTPKPLENVDLKPYLGKTIKHVADYKDDEKAEWLQKNYKFCNVDVPVDEHRHLYEVYDWERIYKIQFPSRHQDAPKRPFELRQNPFLEKMSSRREYIPKALRPDKDLPKWKQKKEKKTFYPEFK